MSNSNEATFTLSIQGQGVSTPEANGQTVREVLSNAGVAIDTPVLVNGAPTTLDAVIPADSIVTSSSKGKGANEEATFTLSIQGQGVSTPEANGQTVREVLSNAGVAIDTPVLVNGAPTTLDAVIPADSIVTSSSKGKGAV